MNTPLATSPTDLAAIVRGQHGDPFSVLGMHIITFDGKAALVVRVFAPEATAVTVVDLESPSSFYPMVQVDCEGFFELVLHRSRPFRYSLRMEEKTGKSWTTRDPYSFLPVLGEVDLHLHAEGNHWRIYEKLGAHPMNLDGVEGVHFAVWAPNATRVSVIGD